MNEQNKSDIKRSLMESEIKIVKEELFTIETAKLIYHFDFADELESVEKKK